MDNAATVKVVDRVMTFQVTDILCQAIRTASNSKKEVNRVKIYMEMLGYSEREAKRLDYFINNITGVPISTTGKAAAWMAEELFYQDDGVNDWPWAEAQGWWNGQGGGDLKDNPDGSNTWVRVEEEQ